MAYTYLITRSDFDDETFELGNISDSRLNVAIQEAQDSDLKQMLGYAMYYDMLKNHSATKYTDLLNGKEYTDVNGYTVEFRGLKYALLYWTYARILNANQITLTSHGVVQKRSDYSDQVDLKAISNAVNDKRSFALVYWQEVERYINSNLTTYTLWNVTRKEFQKTQIRINVIGGCSSDEGEYCNDKNIK